MWTMIQAEAKRLGFCAVGATRRLTPKRYQAYEEWLANNQNATMKFMETPASRGARQDLRRLLPDAQSAIIAALPYRAPSKEETPPGCGRIAAYALGDDYHGVMKEKLAELARTIAETTPGFRWRACVDSAPILERDFAEQAGLGFTGKNTMLIVPGIGSYVFIGVLIVNIDLGSARPTTTSAGCGSCTACLDACPTGAFPKAYRLDARRCISYLTIEHRGTIRNDLREKMGARVFGCDACQSACPYNAGKGAGDVDLGLLPRSKSREFPELSALAQLGNNQHKRLVAGTALRRANRATLQRSTAVAIGNNGCATDEQSLELLEAAGDSVVNEHARWARNRYGSGNERT